MKFYTPIIIVTAMFICFTSCQQNNDKEQPVNIEVHKQDDTDSLNAKKALDELVQKISTSSIYKQYDSLQTILSFEKKMAYDEYAMTRKQNNNAEIVSVLNNSNMALAKKREALLKLGFKLSYEYERVSIGIVLTKTKLLNKFPELLAMDEATQENVFKLVLEKKPRTIVSPI